MSGMRIGIVGATGRVGTRLVESILDSPGLELAAALVSPGSRHAGRPVAGGTLVYRPADAAIRSHCDVMIDFSTPAASLAFQELCKALPLPTVIGTTGFSAEGDARLTRFARHRKILVSANFANGFEAFANAAARFARGMPGSIPALAETYHARKKAVPSGTSRRLAADIRQGRRLAAGFDVGDIPVTVRREADVVGVHEVRFDLGSAEAAFVYRVNTLAAYAEGALAAARWLVDRAPGPGRYSLADSLAFQE
jgi:4-hydroxy-tetrahydrodipicolinate reductase